MDWTILVYVIPIALIIGGLFVFVARSARVRRATEAVKNENAQLREQLRKLSQQTPEPQPSKPRWLTGTEITAIAGLIGTVLGGAGTLMGNLHSRNLEDANAALLSAKSEAATAKSKHDELSANVNALIGPMDDWLGLKKEAFTPRKAKVAHVHLEKRDTQTSCGNPRQLVLSYDGSRPGVLHCPAGTAIIALDMPTRVLLVRE